MWSWYSQSLLCSQNACRYQWEKRFFIRKKTYVITPNPAHVNISAGGVAKYATNKDEAIQLLEFLASPEGSKGLAAPTFEHPLKEVNQNQIVKNFGEFTPDKVTVDDLGNNNSTALKMMKEAGWN